MTKFNLESRGYFQVYLPTVALPKNKINFKKLTVTQRIGEHDTAMFRIESRQLNWFKYLTPGTPVRIVYRSGTDNKFRGQFYGYVAQVQLQTFDDEKKYVRDILCVGASYAFRQAAQHTYALKSPSEIIDSIAQSFNFSCTAKFDGLRKSTITQSGETYWQFMHRLAKKTGYTLRVDNTHLYFMPLTDYARMYLDTAPVLTDYAGYVNGQFQETNVLEIDALASDVSLDQERLTDISVFASVNPVTGDVTFESEKPTVGNRSSRSQFQKFLSPNVAAHSASEAKRLAKGAADNGLMALDTSLTVAGNVRLSPYRPVQLTLRDPNLTGIWLVKEVTHNLTRGEKTSYMTSVTVSTDSIDGISRKTLSRSPITIGLEQRLFQELPATPRLSAATTGFVYGKSTSSSGQWTSG